MPSRAKPHKQEAKERNRGTKQQRGYGGQWERIARLYRESHPVCEMCQQESSVDVDHIRPFRGVDDPLRTDLQNLQALCKACHSKKTKGQA